MDEIFKINESDSENENDYSEEEESKINVALRNKKRNLNNYDSDNSNESDKEEDEDENDEIDNNNGKDDNTNNEIKNNNEKGKNEEKTTKDTKNVDSRFQLSEDFDDSHDDTEKSLEEKNGTTSNKKVKKPLSAEKLKKFTVQQEKTGVVYLSRIPPFMKPIKLRHLLSRYAKIGKIYLAAEDDKIASRRKKYGGNRKKNYTEGWVEFLDKREAKLVVKHLNNQIIGGKKSNWYHDDIWNMKYLHGFKWIHLTERIAYEKAVRAQKLKAEMAQATRESNALLKNVEKAKMIESMEKRKLERIQGGELPAAKKSKKVDTTSESTTPASDKPSTSGENSLSMDKETLKILRKYKQRKPVALEKEEKTINPKQKSVLSKIFN